ncbi:hypothetical protein [Pseudoclavibacter helvolus]|uniref:hypothetical protein n=1 Tax=Pseudoclavibacter helvolus TaxID=255205 RepID=UPI003C72ED8D
MDEIEVLRRVRADQAEPSSSAVAAGRDALLERAARGAGRRAKPRDTHRRTGSLATWAVGTIALTGAAIVSLVVAIALHSGDRPVVAQAPVVSATEASTAEDFLAGAAGRARAAGDPVLGPGDFLKVEVRTLQGHELPPQGHAGGRPDWHFSSIRDFYIPADRGAEWVTTLVGVSYEQAAGADAALVAADIETFQEGEAEMYEAAGLDAGYERAAGGAFLTTRFEDFQQAGIEWSKDPEVALQQVYELTGFSVGREMGALNAIGHLLQPGVVDAGTRAVLIEAAALIPGVRLLDEPVDFSGRQGVAVAVDEGTGYEHQLVFSSETGLAMGVRALGSGGESVDETVVWESTGYSSLVVSAAP